LNDIIPFSVRGTLLNAHYFFADNTAEKIDQWTSVVVQVTSLAKCLCHFRPQPINGFVTAAKQDTVRFIRLPSQVRHIAESALNQLACQAVSLQHSPSLIRNAGQMASQEAGTRSNCVDLSVKGRSNSSYRSAQPHHAKEQIVIFGLPNWHRLFSFRARWYRRDAAQ
jgi:hypothetical protein